MPPGNVKKRSERAEGGERVEEEEEQGIYTENEFQDPWQNFITDLRKACIQGGLCCGLLDPHFLWPEFISL